MHPAYLFVKYLAKSAVGIYFRKIYVMGEDNIPDDGPVIICGNHSNQFIDPMMILKYSKRKVNFTMAASSYNKPTIGTCAKMINVIPVNRPEDYKKKGNGRAYFINSSQIKVYFFLYFYFFLFFTYIS
jgi:glycerol-3-phosphate O-acyltransferase/dihydroxyacetone phosphate acyltransferase